MKRDRHAGNNFAAWGWVGSDVSDMANIGREHILATCHFSNQGGFSICENSYRLAPTIGPTNQKNNVEDKEPEGDPDDVIVISGDEPPVCHKKACRKNPQCLNHLGQEVWENEGQCFAFPNRTTR